jgi:hypothetical protein
VIGMGASNEDRLVIELDDLLEGTEGSAREELSAPVEIIDIEHVPSADEMFVEARKWLRMRDVVVVVVDLKNSTKLTWDEAAKGSARIYEAVTGNVVRPSSSSGRASWTSRATGCSPSSAAMTGMSARCARRSRSRPSVRRACCLRSRITSKRSSATPA